MTAASTISAHAQRGRTAFDPLADAHARLTHRLEELAVVTPYLAHFRAPEIRDHLDGVRTYLHDDVLPQAHSEELTLLPVLDRLGAQGSHLAAAMSVEHDTVRHATGALDEMVTGPLGTRRVRRVAGLLDGIGLLLQTHLDHEAGETQPLLAHIGERERETCVARMESTATGPSQRSDCWWLPENLPIYAQLRGADLLNVEAMVGASCDPSVLTVVRSAIAASSERVDADEWRRRLTEDSRYRRDLSTAEACMRSAGLWPWAGN